MGGGRLAGPTGLESAISDVDSLLAEIAGTAGPYINDMERGLKVPSVTTIRSLVPK